MQDFENFFSLFRGDFPAIIAGPCSAETSEQILETAGALSQDSRVKIFRAGIWKPRTRPNSFEGIGEKALKWLLEARENTGLELIVEVATPEHVESCLNAGIDHLWIGARTTVNPFIVQEIAESLRGVKIPVWIKNPVNPDIQLWIGAFERFQKVGIQQCAAIHRGFSVYEKKSYRNPPMWEIPIEFMRLLPEIPLICDPSHISGNRILIHQLAQRALDLGMKGLMVEVHPNPEQACSDAQQQLTPADFKKMLNELVIKKSASENSYFSSLLKSYRDLIDDVDTQILDLLAQRFSIIDKLADLKAEHNDFILNIPRWDSLLKNVELAAMNYGLDPTFLRQIYCLIHQHSIDHQAEKINTIIGLQSNLHTVENGNQQPS